MNKTVRKLGVFITTMALALNLLAGCSSATQSVQSSASSTTTSTSASTVATNVAQTSATTGSKIGEEDLDSSWDEATATKIALSGTSATIDGSGAISEDGGVTITAAGTYVLSGTLTQGQIVVNAAATDLVRIVLNGVEITNSNGAAIYGEQSKKIVLILAEGTTNTITDGTNYVFEDASTDEPNATLFSKDDLTINGTGSLNVEANYLNGIIAKDDLVIVSGTIFVDAVNNGIRGRDSLTIADGDITVVAGNDGLQSNNSTDTTKGWIELLGGNYTITSVHDAIQAETTLTITGGEYDILAGGGATSAKTTTSANNQSTTTDSEDTTSSTSYKGIKAGGNILVEGGDFTIDSADDAVHSNANVTITSGTFAIATGDDGVHADAALTISDGTINIAQSYEGLEGSSITITGGVIDLVASDDGINVAGGSDGETTAGGFGKDSFTSNSDIFIDIQGGTLNIDAGGDGIDSNSNVTMSGGTVTVSGPTSNGDGALDYDGTFSMTGGTLIAAGSSGMVQAPSTSSTQASLSLYFTSTQAANSKVELKNSNGETLATYSPSKEFQSIVISAQGMEDGSTYSVYVNDSKLVDVTLSGSVTSVSDTGAAVSGGTGSGGMGGGRR